MIIVRENILTFNATSFKCAIGKNGITNNKVEGDGCTPSGKYLIKEIYYRKDKVLLPKLNFKAFAIKEKFGWCDDSSSEYYNKFINFPFKKSAETLFRNDSIYDICCVINYNQNPIVKDKGSAIFLHIARKNYPSTEGCLALKKEDLIFLLTKISSATPIRIFC